MTLNLAEKSVVKSRPSVPRGANLFMNISNVFLMIFVVANKSQSEVNGNMKDVIVANKLHVEDEVDDSCDQELDSATGSAAVTADVVDAGQVSAKTTEKRITGDGVVDMLDSLNQPGDQEDRLQLPSFHASPEIPDIMKVVDDSCSPRQAITDECCSNGSRPLSEAVNQSDTCRRGRLRPLLTCKSPEVSDILKVIDDASSSRQGDISCSSDRRPLLEAVDVSRSDTCSTSTAREHTNVRKCAMRSVNSVRLDRRSATVINISTPEPGQTLQKACSEAVKVRLVPRKKSQTRFATPGRAGKVILASPGRSGNQRCIIAGHAGKMVPKSPGSISRLRHTIPRHAGKMVLKSPGRMDKLRHTYPGLAGKVVLTSPGRAGNLKCATLGCAGNLKQTTPGRAGNKRRATPPGGLSTPKSGARMTHSASVLSPGIARSAVVSPALKRNAKGETALHRAAIKVTSLDHFFIISKCCS